MNRYLERRAKEIPSLGGAKLGPFLESAVQHISPGTSIVEVGSWLGSGTAQIALALINNGLRDNIQIHCYDQWILSEDSETKKAKECGLRFDKGDDTLDWVQTMLDEFGVNITYHQGDLLDAKWKHGNISIYIDDAAKKPELFDHMLRTFGPSWIPNETVIILMDYYMWTKKPLYRFKGHKCQNDFIRQYTDHFEKIDSFKSRYNPSFSNETFLYKGGIDFNSMAPLPISFILYRTYTEEYKIFAQIITTSCLIFQCSVIFSNDRKLNVRRAYRPFAGSPI